MNPVDPLGAVRVVLVATSHGGNIGASARAMRTMGMRALHLVRPRQFPSPDADALATHARDVLTGATVWDRLEDVLAPCRLVYGTTARRRDLQQKLDEPARAASALIEAASAGPVAIVFGNEQSGLDNAQVALCGNLTTIPSDADVPVLNLAQAVQIYCYELRVAAASLQPQWPSEFDPDQRPATHGDTVALLELIEQMALDSGFVTAERMGRMRERIGYLLARGRIDTADVNLLRGLLAALQRHRR